MRPPYVFDNARWVSEHASMLIPADPDATFNTVVHMHPLGGCSVQPMPSMAQFMRLQSIAAMSTYADAVTVCCYEELGRRDDSFRVISRGTAVTSLAGLAYIALHHSDPAVRARAVDTLHRARRRYSPLHLFSTGFVALVVILTTIMLLWHLVG